MLHDRRPAGDETCPICRGDGWTGRYTGVRCPSNDHSNG
jgi:hypothetical protein